MADVSRRRFLKFMGAAGAWSLSGCGGDYPGPSQVALVPAGWNRGEERWIASTCHQCPGGCGIRVRVYEGRAVKIEGNPDHPLNRGGLCPKGQAGLQALYDPDRIPGPMKKVGGRSSTRWEAISWEEALDTVAGKLRELAAAGKPESLLLLGGRFPGHMRALFERLARAYGTPNLVDTESICNRARRLATYLTQGVMDLPGYDLAETAYFMVFGAGFLEAWQPTTYLLRMYGEMREGRPGLRAKIVVVDPRCGVGASKADEWIPIRPGTDGALALGMAHVIVKEGLFDKAFLDEHAFAFEDWKGEDGVEHEGFRKMVLREYPPDRVAQITGVEADVVERLGREFARARPAVAGAGRGAGLHTNALFTNLAIHSLNALVGSLEVPGGVVIQEAPALGAWPEIAQEGLAKPSLAAPGAGLVPRQPGHGALMAALLSGKPYPVEAALVYYTNPLFSGPDASTTREALDRIPFLVSFSPYMDDTTARADLVLPDGSYLERLEDDFIVPSVGFPVLNLRQPVMEPLHDTRQTGDVVIDLARRIGGPVAEAFPWPSYEAALEEALGGEESLHEMKKRGFRSGGPYRFGDWARVLATPSGRFEFSPLVWRRTVEDEARQRGEGVETVLSRLGVEARGDLAFLPHFEAPRFAGDSESFPLHLITYKTMTHAEGRGGNQPWLQESFGLQLVERWSPWAELNPATAEGIGIRNGDDAWIESELGRIRIRVRFHPGVRPDVICMPFEYGHTEYGRWASGNGTNPNLLVSALVDPATGVHAISATRVRVVRA
ncbi:MAG: molybdopterin-dependent oxidoreductase [Planctomycetes bacterium]|nr:molybdopterin-dependent oxidoreductase [Planctomycetota bacterium]